MRNEEEQINQIVGMMTSMIKPMIKQAYGKPESDSVQDQIDIIASSIVRMFPSLNSFLTYDDIRGLMYNMKQKDLDEFYETVQLALGRRV